MNRILAVLAILLLAASSLAGCLGFLEDTQQDDEGPEGSGEEDWEPGQGGAGNETDPGGNDTTRTANVTGTVTVPVDDNQTDDENGNQSNEEEAVADANLRLTLDTDGNASYEATTDTAGQYRFEGLEPGEYTLQIEAACCGMMNVSVSLVAGETKTVDVRLERVDEDLGPLPEGGVEGNTATGVIILSMNAGRVKFELTNPEHLQIELVPELADPLAEGGMSYLLRLYLPDGEEENYDAVNGEPIVTDSVMEGTYEVLVWPPTPGSWDYTLHWCAYTEAHCDD